MTTTFGDYSTSLLLTLADARAFAEVLCIVALVLLLLQREMVRHRPQFWARTGGPGLTAVAVPLAVAWVAIIAQRFAALLT